MSATDERDSQERSLQPFAENIWTVEGPQVKMFSFPFPTRMVVIKLKTGGAWLWSPIRWTADLQHEIEDTCEGPIRHLISPNQVHWLFVEQWKEACPNALFFAPPGLMERKVLPDSIAHSVLSEEADSEYTVDLDQTILWGIIPEVVFFHKSTKTLLVCDYIQRLDPDSLKGVHWFFMHVNGMGEDQDTVPRDLRWLSFLGGKRPGLHKAVQRIEHEWKPDHLIVAHGSNMKKNGGDAYETVQRSFAWTSSS